MFNRLLRGNRFCGSDGVYQSPDSDYPRVLRKNVGHRGGDASFVLHDHRVRDCIAAGRFFRGKAFHAVRRAYILATSTRFHPRSVSDHGSTGGLADFEDANPTTGLDPFAPRRLDTLFIFDKFSSFGYYTKNSLAGNPLRTDFGAANKYYRALTEETRCCSRNL